ncbi:MAG: Ig domain-containing protein [Leptospira sp.]|nr:Ig domain-containing protein [Leptospira sp.]
MFDKVYVVLNSGTMKKYAKLLILLLFSINCESGGKSDESSSTLLLALASGGARSSTSNNGSISVYCGGTSSSTASFTYSAGTAISTISCYTTSSSTATFSISPSLPTGLTSSTSTTLTTFTISGTPTEPQQKTTYTVTATIGNSTGTATIDMTINASAPSYLSSVYGSYVVGVSVSGSSIYKTGCFPCTFSISPSLPSGLTINTSTGAISGTPTATQSSTSYTITASNTAGNLSNTSNSIEITTARINYASSFLYYPVNTAISITPTTVTATTLTYSLTSGTLPAGISLNTTTGVISGTTAGSASSNSITIRGTNTAGNANANLISFRVIAVADLTCNTSGIAAGCQASTPYSCNNSSLCYGSLSSCRQTAPTGSCQY